MRSFKMTGEGKVLLNGENEGNYSSSNVALIGKNQQEEKSSRQAKLLKCFINDLLPERPMGTHQR